MKICLENIDNVYKLKHLTRYNPRPRLTNESVAEHSYYVTLFAQIISHELNLPVELQLDCVKHAMFHDLPEIYISDIPWNVKENFPEIKKVAKSLEIDAYAKICPSIHKFEKEMIDNLENEADWKYVVVEKVVELADILSIVQYYRLEQSLGNTKLHDVEIQTIERIKICSNELFDIIDEYNDLMNINSVDFDCAVMRGEFRELTESLAYEAIISI